MPEQLMLLVWVPAITIVVVVALVDGIARARQLRRQSALSDLAALSWATVRGGGRRRLPSPRVQVREVGGRGRADGGVDLVFVRNGESTVVQVKHWRRDVVGVSLVRELYGVQRASAAASAIFVTMGRFSSGAIAFADQVGMTLVDGPELLRIIGAGLAGMPFEVPLTIDTSVPTCPACGADMVERTAGRGAHAGEPFWGCSAFPACRATRPLDAEPLSAR